MERSPVSQNPIVPLPLSPGVHNQLPPSVREYLDSFKAPQQQQQVFPQHQQSSSSGSYGHSPLSGNQNSYSSDGTEISPVSIYGMSTLPSPQFQSEPGSYLPQQSMQNIMQVQQQKSGSSQHQGSSSMDTSGGTQNDSSFPQYFPVYDYGLSSSSYSSNGNMYPQEQQQQQQQQQHALMLDTSAGSSQRRGSGSPDTNMQSTWLDFVNTMAM
ncbi:hypothetical protein D9613_006790 [Agrocybe pediades]|uniref:Uncharacterized protein n=1 Tax=Agrocybe pediades TaxID=84607 RepID=A0A8H4QHF1_9AGAR|nr:hypothetical protein D9613_006790 [Agrocybe pediades]